MPIPEEILTELEGLRIKRESLFARIQNVLDSSRTLTSENVRLFRPRIDKLVELEARFEGIQDQIIDRNSQIKIAADKLEVLNVQKACASTNTCKHCNGKHHTLLHAEKDSTKEIPPNSTTVILSCRTTNNLLPHHVLLGTVQLFIQDEAGIFWPIRAVVDPGSQISAITLRTVNRLGLRRSQAKNIEVSGISGSYTKTQGIVNCTLRSKYSSESLKVNAVVC
ncbi:hypothetical protein Zmor_000104 [Zophobas morio]|uniref:Peptidase A2 domain-containing protein n=1 Tax=Zophobas morio TaxID=2755281 RepID=A0AA38J087_9CUCU|nr:hypothetical protein Zmor_000104 [Zophobas morio]